ncbi:MAG TPA: helicase HerA-like domain-containing protein, partial [Pyrinomonadaceae bacterium]
LDIPEVVLGQLGNRVQHALRAFTPRDQKAMKAAAETFRQNPKLKVENVLTELAVGEALVSMLDENGSPRIVERAKIVPPRSQVGAITSDQRKQIMSSSVFAGRYEKAEDSESVYEMLEKGVPEKAQAAGAGLPGGEQTQSPELAEALGTGKSPFEPKIGPRGGRQEPSYVTVIKSVSSFARSRAGEELIRGLLGTFVRSPRSSKAEER